MYNSCLIHICQYDVHFICRFSNADYCKANDRLLLHKGLGAPIVLINLFFHRTQSSHHPHRASAGLNGAGLIMSDAALVFGAISWMLWLANSGTRIPASRSGWPGMCGMQPSDYGDDCECHCRLGRERRPQRAARPSASFWADLSC